MSASSGLLLLQLGLVSGGALEDPAARRCFDSTEEPEEFEPYAAVNPRDPNHVVAVWMLGDDRARWIVQSASSRDGGASWSSPVTPKVSACAGSPVEWITSFHDEWVAIGPEGRVYLSALVARWNEEPYHAGVMVVSSPDGGRSWQEAVVVAESEDRRESFDNTAVAADPSREGIAYVAATAYIYDVPSLDRSLWPPSFEVDDHVAGRLAFAKTVDGGRTWTPMRRITPERLGRRVSAPQLLVDPRDQAVYTIYFEADMSDKRNAEIRVMRSADGGESWSPARKVADFVPVEGGVRLLLSELRLEAGDDIVSIDIDDASGALYVAFADARFTEGKLLQIALTRSLDSGESWSEPIRVNADHAVLAWLPALSVGSGGALAVSYQDLADPNPRQFATVPVNVRRRELRFEAKSLTLEGDETLDRFNLLGSVYVNSLQTSDYLSQVATSRGFLTVYVKSNCGPYSIDCAGLPSSGRIRDLTAVHAR